MKKQIQALIEEHRRFLIKLQNEYADDGEAASIIEERLVYLDTLAVESTQFRIRDPDIYDDVVARGPLAYSIARFNRAFSKLTSDFATDITLSNHMPTSGDVCDIIEDHTKKLKILTIDAEYFDSELLLNPFFVEAVNAAPNFYYLDAAIGEQGEYDEVDEEDVCNFLSEQLSHDKFFLIKWTCGKVFFKNTGESDVKCILYDEVVAYGDDFSEDDFQTSLENKFDIGLIYKGIGAGYISYSGPELSMYYDFPPDIACIDSAQEFDGWRIIDYAAKHGDMLVIQEMTKCGHGISTKNSIGESALEIAVEHGCPNSIIALLDLVLPLAENSILPPLTQQLLEKEAEVTGYTPLASAAKAGKYENIRLLLRLGADPNKKCRGGETAIGFALDNGHYGIALALLEMGAKFPDTPDLSAIGDGPLEALCEARLDIENRIKAGDINEIKRLVACEKLPHRFITKDNCSALFLAYSNNQFGIYAFLRTNGFALLDEEQNRVAIDLLTEPERQQMKREMVAAVNRPSYSTVIFLLSKSRILQADPRYFDRVKEMFTTLVDIDEIKAVFEVLEYAGKSIDIIFDFDSSNIEEISASVGSQVAGSCDFNDGRIFIGASVADPMELLGTLAHELTHQAMQILYENSCNPFPADDSLPIKVLQMSVDQVIREAKEKACDDIIKRVFTVYKQKDWPAEIIVRVPHILAKYGDYQGREILEKETPLLLKFYDNRIFTACKSFVIQKQKRGLSEDLSLETKLSQHSFDVGASSRSVQHGCGF